ncbi:MAG: response regulator transcription factor [Defluviitaleaceae bacterium]|nr:response regulator transcription factor [Defluviitaleaceae bacterium]
MKLLIVDDDELILQSLKMSLGRNEDFEVETAGDGAAAVEACARNVPDVVLMDIQMPGTDGIAATRLIKSRFPSVKIMMLTTFDDKENIRQALAAGADGYLLKTDKIRQIGEKLRLLAMGAGILDADVLQKLTPRENPALESLTPREKDIARLVAQGFANKKIAETLFLSEGTVRNNIVVIMEKLGVENRTQLGLAYFERESRVQNNTSP